jgi:hypothetical protein
MKNSEKFYRFIGPKDATHLDVYISGFFSENIEVADGTTIAFLADLQPEHWEEAPEDSEGVTQLKEILLGIGEEFKNHMEYMEEEELQAQADFETELIVDFSLKLIDKFEPPKVGSSPSEIIEWYFHIQTLARHMKDGIVADRELILKNLRHKERR